MNSKQLKQVKKINQIVKDLIKDEILEVDRKDITFNENSEGIVSLSLDGYNPHVEIMKDGTVIFDRGTSYEDSDQNLITENLIQSLSDQADYIRIDSELDEIADNCLSEKSFSVFELNKTEAMEVGYSDQAYDDIISKNHKVCAIVTGKEYIPSWLEEILENSEKVPNGFCSEDFEGIFDISQETYDYLVNHEKYKDINSMDI
jgi:PHD/YefM family antitoxin component YafN of YafNO toxin-antitoxin module